MDYRKRALKILPWICASCAREFTGKNLRQLTVHHKDHDHTNNPADGSNWEILTGSEQRLCDCAYKSSLCTHGLPRHLRCHCADRLCEPEACGRPQDAPALPASSGPRPVGRCGPTQGTVTALA